jgi:hypothetical protein
LASDVNSQVILVNFLGTIPQVDQYGYVSILHIGVVYYSTNTKMKSSCINEGGLFVAMVIVIV